jgi:hypothetical protein
MGRFSRSRIEKEPDSRKGPLAIYLTATEIGEEGAFFSECAKLDYVDHGEGVAVASHPNEAAVARGAETHRDGDGIERRLRRLDGQASTAEFERVDHLAQGRRGEVVFRKPAGGKRSLQPAQGREQAANPRLGEFADEGVDRLAVLPRPLLTFTIGIDKAGSPMMVLNDMDELGDTLKRAIVIVPDQKMALKAVAMIDRFYGDGE